MTNPTFSTDNILMSDKMLINDSRSLDSRTPSALSRTNVTWFGTCMLQFVNHCPGFSRTCVLALPHELIIPTTTSLKSVFVCKLQNSTVIFVSDFFNSCATLLATVVFPNPGPPVIRTTGVFPPSASFLIRSMCLLRPNTSSSGISRGRQWRRLLFCCSCTLFHFSACSSERRFVSWSMGLFFSASISSLILFHTT